MASLRDVTIHTTSVVLSELASAPCSAWLHNWRGARVRPMLERELHGEAFAPHPKTLHAGATGRGLCCADATPCSWRYL